MVPLRSCCQLKLQHSHGTRVSSCSLKVPDACSSLYLTDLLAEASFSKMREISPRKRPRKQRKRTSRNNTRGRTAEGFRGRVRYFIENLLGIKTTAQVTIDSVSNPVSALVATGTVWASSQRCHASIVSSARDSSTKCVGLCGLLLFDSLLEL